VASTYNILVIGVPFYVTANTTLLSSFTHENSVDEYDAANTMVEDNYSTEPCLGGVFATYGGKYTGAWSSNVASFSGLQQVFGSTRFLGYGAFWAFNGDKNVMCRQP